MFLFLYRVFCKGLAFLTSVQGNYDLAQPLQEWVKTDTAMPCMMVDG